MSSSFHPNPFSLTKWSPHRTNEIQKTAFQAHSAKRPLRTETGSRSPVETGAGHQVSVNPTCGPPPTASLPSSSLHTGDAAAAPWESWSPELPSQGPLSASPSCSSAAGRGKRPKDWVSPQPRQPGPQSHRLSGSQAAKGRNSSARGGPDHPPSAPSTGQRFKRSL